MNGTLKLLVLLTISLLSSHVYASQFTHIKLKPEFESSLTENNAESSEKVVIQSGFMKGLAMKSRSAANVKALAIQAVMGSSTTALKSSGDWTSPFPNDGEESPIYEQIRRELEASHQQIGLGEVTQLDLIRRQFNLGVDNFSGFSWQKPFGAIQVWADRQVTPNLFGSNWLVQDTFTMDIAASTFLEKLAEVGATDMSGVDIGAFAGITFRRVYTTYHYANSYDEGLRADFTRLFLPFLKFYPKAATNLGLDEIIKKEDTWTVKAGGMVTSPPIYGVSGSVGVIAQASYQSMLSVQSASAEVIEKERLRVSLKQTKGAMVGANASLQLDFFKLLKLTIFSADLEYTFDSAKEFQLSLPPSSVSNLTSDSAEGKEFKKILRGYAKLDVLEPYVTQLNENDSSSFAQRGSVLIWGKLSKTKTEQVRVIKDGNVATFYKNTAQNVKVVQNFLSRIFGAVIYKIFKFPLGTKNAAYYSNEITLEYAATHPQAGKPDVMKIDATEQASLLMTTNYEAARTDRWVDRKFKNDVLWIVDSFTTLPKSYVSIIKNEQLKGPMKVVTNIRIEKSGLDYMFYQPLNNVIGPIADACNSKRKSNWLDSSKRERMLKNLQIGKDLCVKNLVKSYYAFKNDLNRDGKPSLALLKKMLTKFMKEANNINEIKSLFGAPNVFISGQIQATSSNGQLFTAPFSEGNFKGLGVIDNYKRTLGSRTPASVLNE